MSVEDEGLERGIRSGRCSDVIHLIPWNITEWRPARSLARSQPRSLPCWFLALPRSCHHTHILFFFSQQQLLRDMPSALSRFYATAPKTECGRESVYGNASISRMKGKHFSVY